MEVIGDCSSSNHLPTDLMSHTKFQAKNRSLDLFGHVKTCSSPRHDSRGDFGFYKVVDDGTDVQL